MPKDELPNHNCIKHLRSVVQQQQTKISELEKTVAEHKHQLGEQVRTPACSLPSALKHCANKVLSVIFTVQNRFLRSQQDIQF